MVSTGLLNTCFFYTKYMYRYTNFSAKAHYHVLRIAGTLCMRTAISLGQWKDSGSHGL